MVTSTGWQKVNNKLMGDCTGGAPLRAAREILEVTSNQTFHSIPKILSKKLVSIPKHRVVAHTTNSMMFVLTTKATFLKFKIDTVTETHNKL